LKLYESGENYLETILLLERRKGTVRAVDIATELSFSKPSISRAMGLLRQAELVTVDENGSIRLTEEGRARAEQIYERHSLLRFFLVCLGVEEEVADADACRIEHVISEQSFQAIKCFLEREGGAAPPLSL